MIEKIISFCLSKRYIIIAIVILIVGLGVWAWIELKIEAYPDVGDTKSR